MAEQVSPVTYADLQRNLTLTEAFYSTPEGAQLMIHRRDQMISKIVELSGHNVSIFSIGYPNYILDYSNSLAEPRLDPLEFTAVPEILQYVQRTRDKIIDKTGTNTWPCQTCFPETNFVDFKTDSKFCSADLKPFFYFTTLPDIDLYIITDSSQNVRPLVDKLWSNGLHSPEHNIKRSLSEFPLKLSPDLHFITESQLVLGLSEMRNLADWPEFNMPMLADRGKLIESNVCFGLDFVFSALPHFFHSEELKNYFLEWRANFVLDKGINAIFEAVIKSRFSNLVPKRIGRLVDEYPSLADIFKKRMAYFVKSYLDCNINTGCILPEVQCVEDVYTVLEVVSQSTQKVTIIPKNLAPIISTYAPSFVDNLAINDQLKQTGNKENWDLEALAQVYVAHGVLDNLIFEGTADQEKLSDRQNRIRLAAHRLGITLQEPPPINCVEDVVLDTKQISFAIFTHFDRKPKEVVKIQKSINSYSFVEPIAKLLGPGLNNIILYGSSRFGGKGNDYDLILVVETLDKETYKRIKSKQADINAHCDREVHIQILDKSNVNTYFNLDIHSPDNLELLYGDSFDYPVFEPITDWLAALPVHKITRLLAGAQECFQKPERNLSKPQVLHGPLKLHRYLIQAYQALYPQIPQTFFTNLSGKISTPVFNPNPTTEDVKNIRAIAINNLVYVTQQIDEELKVLDLKEK